MRSEWTGPPVAIVGGGFSGVMTAAHLTRRGVPCLLIEGGDRLGRGLAYSTTEPAHVLNVPSARMSAWPEVPDDFQRWLGDDGTSFAERSAFGRYVQDIFGSLDGVRVVRQRCEGAERSGAGWRLRFADGSEAEATTLVLAQGNQPPAPYRPGAELPFFINNPWSPEAASAIRQAAETGADVLLLGTGLTMIDSLLSLEEAGHRGRITALSRRGLLPRAHAAHQAAPVTLDEVPLGRVLTLSRWLRRRSGEVGFRAAVDSLRPHTRAIWQSWSLVEQRRFLRHARAWWDVYRHRIAPHVAERLAAVTAEGRLEVIAGRLESLSTAGEALIKRRGGADVTRQFGLVINCTGPLGDLSRTEDPLLRSLVEQGEVRLDAHRLGLRVDERARLSERFWAVGPLTKGMYWEIVAVPDIRVQVAQVADDVARELGAG